MLPVYHMFKSLKVNIGIYKIYIRTSFLNVEIHKSAAEPQKINVCDTGEEDNSPGYAESCPLDRSEQEQIAMACKKSKLLSNNPYLSTAFFKGLRKS